MSISPSGKKWLISAGNDDDYDRFIIDVSAGTAKRLAIQGVTVGKSDALFGFHWSPDETRLAISKAKGYDDDNVGPWPRTLIIVDVRTNKAAVPCGLEGVCSEQYAFLAPSPWLDANRLLLCTDRKLMSDVLGTLSVVDLPSNTLEFYTRGNSASVLPGKRVLVSTNRYDHEYKIVDADTPQNQVGILGGSGQIGSPTQEDLDKGIRPPMHTYYSVSPDGNWVLVEVAHVVGTLLGFAAPSSHVYLRRVDDSKCFLLGGDAVAQRIDPGVLHWVALPADVTSKLGLPHE